VPRFAIALISCCEALCQFTEAVTASERNLNQGRRRYKIRLSDVKSLVLHLTVDLRSFAPSNERSNQGTPWSNTRGRKCNLKHEPSNITSGQTHRPREATSSWRKARSASKTQQLRLLLILRISDFPSRLSAVFLDCDTRRRPCESYQVGEIPLWVKEKNLWRTELSYPSVVHD